MEVHGGQSVWPLHVFPSGCRVKPTGQLQRTPVDVSLQVQSHPPLFTAHVSETTGHCVNACHWLILPLCGKDSFRHWHALQSWTCDLHQKHTTQHKKVYFSTDTMWFVGSHNCNSRKMLRKQSQNTLAFLGFKSPFIGMFEGWHESCAACFTRGTLEVYAGD